MTVTRDQVLAWHSQWSFTDREVINRNLDRLDARIFKSFVQMDLFAGHAFGFDHHRSAEFFYQIDNDLTRFFSVACPVDRRTGFFCVFDKFQQIFVEVKQRFFIPFRTNGCLVSARRPACA